MFRRELNNIFKKRPLERDQLVWGVGKKSILRIKSFGITKRERERDRLSSKR